MTTKEVRDAILQTLLEEGPLGLRELRELVPGNVRTAYGYLLRKGLIVECNGGRVELPSEKRVNPETVMIEHLLNHYRDGQWLGTASLASKIGVSAFSLKQMQHEMCKRGYIGLVNGKYQLSDEQHNAPSKQQGIQR